MKELRARGRDETGFTLVELLLVMLILGILAAIAVPAFFSQRDKGRDADAKTQVRHAHVAMETFATENSGSYATATLAKLQVIEPTLKSTVSVGTPTATGYTLTATSGTNNTFSITRATTGAVTHPCTRTGNPSAGCPSTLRWNP